MERSVAARKSAQSALIAAVALLPLAASGDAAAQASGIGNLRDARYCEIIPVVRDGIHFVATVYNTLGLNDCPAALWEGLREDALKKRFGATKVMLNGPRHFLMDAIAAQGDSAAGDTIDVNGLALTRRATIRLSLAELQTGSYREKAIERETQYVFGAGKPVFMLEAPDGSRYVMQAYAQIVDKTLSYDALPKLGARLKLPKGWRYTTRVPDKDLVVAANGEAIVVQDDLDDTYQKLR